MLKKKLTYFLACISCGTWISSCSVFNPSPYEKVIISEKNISNSKKPKIVQLRPDDCPWTKTYIIKNVPDRKEYGSSYAKKQNRKLKDAL